jgi:hypothetical protein
MPTGGAGATKSQVAIYMAISFTRTTHFTPSTGQSSAPDPPGVQGAIQATWELHPDGKPGAEVTWVGQVAVGQDPGSPDKGFKVQSLLSGPQAAYVIPFLNGTLQLAPVIQMLAGVQRVQHEDRIYRLVPTTQVGAGGQAVYTIPGTNGHLQLGGQAAAAITDPARADLTVDYGYQVFLQWKF